MVLCVTSGFLASVHEMVICNEVLMNCHSLQQKIPESAYFVMVLIQNIATLWPSENDGAAGKISGRC